MHQLGMREPPQALMYDRANISNVSESERVRVPVVLQDLLPVKWLCRMAPPHDDGVTVFRELATHLLLLILEHQDKAHVYHTRRFGKNTVFRQTAQSMFLEEWKVWLTNTLPGFTYSMDCLAELQRRAAYALNVLNANVFPDADDTGFGHILGSLHDALTEAGRRASIGAAHASLGDHMKRVDYDLRHLLLNGAMFLYFVFRSTRDTPSALGYGMHTLRQPVDDDLQRVMGTLSGQVLSKLLKGPCYRALFPEPRAKQAIELGLVGEEVSKAQQAWLDSYSNPFMDDSGHTRLPDSIGQMEGSLFGTNEAGIVKLFQSDERVMERFVVFHALLHELARVTCVIDHARALIRASQPVLPQGYKALRRVLRMAELFVERMNSEVKILGDTAASVYQQRMAAQQTKEYRTKLGAQAAEKIAEQAKKRNKEQMMWHSWERNWSCGALVASRLKKDVRSCLRAIGTVLSDVSKFQFDPDIHDEEVPHEDMIDCESLLMFNARINGLWAQLQEMQFALNDEDDQEAMREAERAAAEAERRHVELEQERALEQEKAEAEAAEAAEKAELEVKEDEGDSDSDEEDRPPNRGKPVENPLTEEEIQRFKEQMLNPNKFTQDTLSDQERVKRYVHEAEQHLLADDPSAAIRSFTNAIKLRPDEPGIALALYNAAKKRYNSMDVRMANAGLMEEEIDALVERLRTQFLLSVDVSGNALTFDQSYALLRAAEDCHTLRTLCIGNNPIGDEGAYAIATILSLNPAVTSVNISNAAITETGAQHIGKALINSTTLISLDISGNPLGDSAVATLVKAMSANPELRLQELGLAHTQMGNRAGTALQSFLRGDTNMVRLDVDKNPELDSIVSDNLQNQIKARAALFAALNEDDKKNLVYCEEEVLEDADIDDYCQNCLRLILEFGAEHVRRERMEPSQMLAESDSESGSESEGYSLRLNLYTHLRVFPVFVRRLHDKLDEDDTALQEVYAGIGKLVQVLLLRADKSKDPHPTSAESRVFERNLHQQLEDWLASLSVVAEAVKQRLWENIRDCLSLAEDEPEVLEQTVSVLKAEDDIDVDDSTRMKLLDGFYMARRWTRIKSLTVVAPPAQPLMQKVYTELSRAIEERFDEVLRETYAKEDEAAAAADAAAQELEQQQPSEEAEGVTDGGEEEEEEEELDLDAFMNDEVPEKSKTPVVEAQTEKKPAVPRRLEDLSELVTDMGLVKDGVMPCFPEEYQIIPFFQRAYHQRVAHMINVELGTTRMEAEEVLKCVQWMWWYYGEMEALNMHSDHLKTELDMYTDKFMQQYVMATKTKLQYWANNILDQEQSKLVIMKDEDGFCFTPASQDLFSSFNNVVSHVVDAYGLRNRAVVQLSVLCRESLHHYMEAHLAYIRTVAVLDEEEELAASERTRKSTAVGSLRRATTIVMPGTPSKPGTMVGHVDNFDGPEKQMTVQNLKPLEWILAQINNCEHFEKNADQLCTSLTDRMDEIGDEEVEAISDAFDDIVTAFWEAASHCVEILVQHVVASVEPLLKGLFGKRWLKRHAELAELEEGEEDGEGGVIEDVVEVVETQFEELCGGISRQAYFAQLVKMVMKKLGFMYWNKFFAVRPPLHIHTDLFNYVKKDEGTLLEFFLQFEELSIPADLIRKSHGTAELFSTVCHADEDFLQVHFKQMLERFHPKAEFAAQSAWAGNPLVVLQALLGIRGDLSTKQQQGLVEDFRKALPQDVAAQLGATKSASSGLKSRLLERSRGQTMRHDVDKLGISKEEQKRQRRLDKERAKAEKLAQRSSADGDVNVKKGLFGFRKRRKPEA